MTIFRPDLFDLPPEMIYLDGNSLGPLTHATRQRLAEVVDQEWAPQLIGGWNGAGWFEQPGRVGDLIAPLIGAAPGTVMTGDTLTLKVQQALQAALSLRPGRTKILSDTGNFPTDLYVARAIVDAVGGELILVKPEEVEQNLNQEIAAVLLTEVDYRTARRHDMARLTYVAHSLGILTVWDLAHSAGAIPVNLALANADFAVGCTYKYLNGGPGAPAFIYARADLVEQTHPATPGWMGHAAPFDFDLEYRPAVGAQRWRIGTPPVLQMSALEAALHVWQDVDMGRLYEQSQILSEAFIRGVEQSCPQVSLVSPRDPNSRGSHVSFAFADAFATIQALIARGVVGDFRAPNLMRFGFCPLYNSEAQIGQAVRILSEIIEQKTYEDPKFNVKAQVT